MYAILRLFISTMKGACRKVLLCIVVNVSLQYDIHYVLLTSPGIPTSTLGHQRQTTLTVTQIDLSVGMLLNF